MHSWVPLLHLWAKRMEMRISLQQTHKAAVPKASGSAGPSAASVSRTTFSEKPAVYPSGTQQQSAGSETHISPFVSARLFHGLAGSAGRKTKK